MDGYVTAVFLGVGDHVAKGQELFALIDSSSWWVVMYTKESYVSYSTQHNKASIWLASQPNIVFNCQVYGAGWGVNRAEDSSSAAQSILPYVKKTENWIQLEQRFPIRIDFDPKGLNCTWDQMQKCWLN